MKFTETKLKGSYIVEPKLLQDERGSFAEMWRQNEFEKLGLETEFLQANISVSSKKGTLRGMHFQIKPHAQVKLVRCTMGAIYDVIIDLRPESKTYCQWVSVELSAENRTLIYIPEGFAHGFQTLKDNSEVSYQMFQYYNTQAERGVRWNDPHFKIDWPIPVVSISDRDQAYEDFKEGAFV